MSLFGKTRSKLTPRQRAQRKYASAMRTVRKRAKTASGGRGRIGTRSAATKLRRKYGLRTPGSRVRKTARKAVRKTRTGAKRARRTVKRRV